MHPPRILTVPHWRAVARHAIPNVVEGKLIPLLVFVGLLRLAGMAPALIGALAWSGLALLRRVLKKQTVSGILVLTTLALTARTIAALATGSLLVYFLQPTVATSMVGAAFLLSVPLGRPLAERLALDLCPFDDETRSHPVLQRFFRHLSLWWGFTSMINFAITLWLLLTQSATTFVLVKSVLGPATTTVTFAVAFFWFRSLMGRAGTKVVVAAKTTPLPTRAAVATAA